VNLLEDRPLDQQILEKLREKTRYEISTIRKDISLLRRRYGRLPINAVAQIYALEKGTSVLTRLTKEERESLPSVEIERPTRIAQKKSGPLRKRKLIEFAKYNTTDQFIRAHIIETNKAYTYGCYTATFILCRKIIENLLTDIIRRKYPPNKKEHLELYFDTGRGRTRDFSEILSNLRKGAKDFGPDRVLLERMLSRAEIFKDDANNKAHSWYHIVRSKKELDDTNFQDIIEMIVRLERNLPDQSQTTHTR